MLRDSSGREPLCKAGSLGPPAEACIGRGHLRSRRIFMEQRPERKWGRSWVKLEEA